MLFTVMQIVRQQQLRLMLTELICSLGQKQTETVPLLIRLASTSLSNQLQTQDLVQTNVI